MKKLQLLIAVVFCLGLTFSSSGQGTEGFDNFPNSGNSYQNGTFVGTDGSTWSYTQCRGDILITDATPLLGKNRDPQAKIESGSIENGCGTLQFDYTQGFSTPSNMEVYVGGTLVANIVSTVAGQLENTGVINCDVEGAFTFEFVQPDGSGQLAIDNLVWTEYGTASGVSTPVISPNGGTFYEPVEVTISCSTENSTIYYTTDGTTPTDASTTYTAPFTLSETATVKAIGYVTGLAPSNIKTVEYTISVNPPIFFQDFNDQEWNGWQSISVVGTAVWTITNSYGIDNTPCAKATGYDSGAGPVAATDTWLVSPAVDMSGLENPVFSFWNATQYDGIALEVKYSEDFTGDITAATWMDLAFTPSAGEWAWTFGGDIDVSAITGTNVVFAFRFQCNDTESATWEVDNIQLIAGGTPPPPTNEVNQDWNDLAWKGWNQKSISGDQVWDITEAYGIDDSPCIKMQGYDGTATATNEDWLISPAFNLADYSGPTFSFYTAMNYTGNAIEVFFSNDYNGSDVAGATWTPLTATLSAGSFDWTPSGNIDLSGFTGDNVYVAFKYTCDDASSATWEVDNILVSNSGTVQAPIANFETDATVVTEGSTITFTDLSLGTPTSWSWTISGEENMTSTEQNPALEFATAGTYNVELVATNDGGSNTKYAESYITVTADAGPSVTIFEQDFNDQDWKGWESITAVGTAAWEITESYGIDNTPCGKATGYDSGAGASLTSDVWLISPAVDMSGLNQPIFSFWNANYYTGMAMEVKYSEDFAGDVATATWTDLTFIASEGLWAWTSSGDIDVSTITGTAVVFAFRFQSDDAESMTWEVDNILLIDITSVEQSEAIQFNLYPNPASDKVSIAGAAANAQVSVYNTTGQIVLTSVFNQNTTIDVSGLATGIYIIKISDLDSSATGTQRLIVK